MSRFSLLGLGNNGTPAATLPMSDFSVPRGSEALSAGLAAGANRVGEGIVARGQDQAAADYHAQVEARRQAAEAEQAAKEAARQRAEIYKADLNLWDTNLDTSVVVAQRESVAEAAKQPTYEASIGVIDARYELLREQAKSQPDAQARAKALLGIERSYTAAKEQASTAATARISEQTGVSIDENIRQNAAGVADGTVSVPQAFANVRKVLDGNAESLGPKQTQAAWLNAGKQIIDSAIATATPEMQIAMSKDPAFLQFHTADQAKGVQEQAQKKIEERNKQTAIDLKNTMDKTIGQVLLGPVPPSNADVQRVVDAHADAIHELYPAHTKDSIIEGALGPRLADAAEIAKTAGKEYAQRYFNAVSPSMPNTASAQEIVRTQQNELNENGKLREQKVTDADKILAAFVSNGPMPAGLPNDSLNDAYKQAGDPAGMADWMLRHQIPFPRALVDDLSGMLGGTHDAPQPVRLETAMPILVKMYEANPITAKRQLAAMGEAGAIGRTAIEQTRGAKPGSLAYASVVNTISDPRFRGSVATLNGKDHLKQTAPGTYYANVTSTVGGLFSDDVRQRYDLTMAYNFAYAQQHPEIAGSDPVSQESWAQARSIASLKERTVNVSGASSTGFLGYGHWGSNYAVPSDVLGVGSNARPDQVNIDAFNNAMNNSWDNLHQQFPENNISLRPDLAMRDGLVAIVPAILNGETKLAGAVVWNPYDRSARVVAVDSPEARQVRMMVESGLPADIVADDAGLRHPFGVTKSVKTFDETFYRDDIEHGLAAQLLNLSGEQWKLAHHGLMPDWSDKDQKESFTTLLRANTERLGWSFSEPDKPAGQ